MVRQSSWTWDQKHDPENKISVYWSLSKSMGKMVEALWKVVWQLEKRKEERKKKNPKHTHSIWPRNCFIGIYHRDMRRRTHKNLYPIVHSSFICNSQKLETTKMPFNRWMVQQIVQQYMDILWIHTTRINLKKHYAKWKKPFTEGFPLYDPLAWQLGKGKSRATKVRPVVST